MGGKCEIDLNYSSHETQSGSLSLHHQLLLFAKEKQSHNVYFIVNCEFVYLFFSKLGLFKKDKWKDIS